MTKKSLSYWIFIQTKYKFYGIGGRILYMTGQIPKRFMRIVHHFNPFHPTQFHIAAGKKKPPNIVMRFGNWLGALCLYLVELAGICELYDILNDIVKFNTRHMTPREIEVARSVYGDTIRYDLIRIDEGSYIGPKQQSMAYVSFHTINFWGKMTDSHLIHELVHVWQYERLGMMYMPLALKAQFSKMGYDYGGLKLLEKNKGAGFHAFNLEQQGDLTADYFRLTQGKRPYWGFAKPKDLPLYEVYINEIKRS